MAAENKRLLPHFVEWKGRNAVRDGNPFPSPAGEEGPPCNQSRRFRRSIEKRRATHHELPAAGVEGVVTLDAPFSYLI